MVSTDPLADMLTRIRNAHMRGKTKVNSPNSKLRRWVLDVLQEEGYIRGYEVITNDKGFPEIEISLKYFNGLPVITEINRVSKPGRRVYMPVSSIPRHRNGLGIAIVSTSKGVMSGDAARDNKVGGEILCTVF